MAAAVPSKSGSPASSVDSAELQSLLVELNILPDAAAIPLQHQQQGRAKRQFALDSDSDGECSPSSSRPQASPRLDDSDSLLAAATAAAPPPLPERQQQYAQRGRAPPAPVPEPEVIEILDSSSNEEEEDDADEDWCISAPATSHKQRRQVVDSDSSDDGFAERGAAVGRTAGSTLLPCFAAIPSLAAQQQVKPAQQLPLARLQQTAAPPAPPPTSAGTTAGPARPLSASAFKRQRKELAAQLFAEFNRAVFGGRLPANLEISWNARLLTTAGLTHYRRDIPDDPYAPPIYSARVELSSKVLDSFPKLERTLCHELCHVAAWLVDHTAKPPHGPVFRRWAEAAMARYPHLDITTCHAYEIFYPFRWQCSNSGCLQTYGRHSNSIDITKKVCGACRAPLTFLGRFRPDGTPAKQRAASPNKYAQFVKENHADVRAQLPAGTPQAEVMRKLSERYASLRGEASAASSRAEAGDSAGVTASGSGSLLSLGSTRREEGEVVTSPLRDVSGGPAFQVM